MKQGKLKLITRSGFMRLVSQLFVVLTLLLSIAPASQAQAAQCFPETGYCIQGLIQQFWQRNGGLRVFGYPLSNEQYSAEGRVYQIFERHVIELHPEHAAPYNVQLSLIGQQLFAAYTGQTVAQGQEAQNGCRWFAETQQNLCAPFLSAWHQYGLQLDNNPGITEAENLALFGLPISSAFEIRESDGSSKTVQYFQRARFEFSANQAQIGVQFGLLGREWATLNGETPSGPVAQPMPAEPEPAEDPAPQGRVIIVEEPGTVRRGATASVKTRSGANVQCDINVYYKSGPSSAAGLYPKTTDANGYVSWSWKVGTRTTSGSWPVEITCGRASVRTYVHVP
jgi:hypothetical protein